MREEFAEAFHSAHQDPLDGEAGHSSTDFDWEGLFRGMGETAMPLDESDRPAVAYAMKAFIAWCLAPRKGKGYTDRIGRRVIAVAYLIQAGSLEGVSLRQISATCGRFHEVLSNDVGDAARKFRLRNRLQSHAMNGRHAARRRETNEHTEPTNQ